MSRRMILPNQIKRKILLSQEKKYKSENDAQTSEKKKMIRIPLRIQEVDQILLVKTGDPCCMGIMASLFGSSRIAGAVIRRRKKRITQLLETGLRKLRPVFLYKPLFDDK